MTRHPPLSLSVHLHMTGSTWVNTAINTATAVLCQNTTNTDQVSKSCHHNTGFGYPGMYPKTRRFFGYTHLKNGKNQQKTHLKSNCIVLFDNTFCYFEVLKPISRTLLNIFRYSKVLVSILKPKTQKGLAV